MAKLLVMQQLSNNLENPFRDVGHMCQALDLNQSKYGLGWRLTEYKLGAIHGLPMSRGRICASDGISCVIITETGFYIGHHDWFQIEKRPWTMKVQSAKATKQSVSIKKLAIINELNALLDV